MLCALIMAGGKGSRFWPLSTEERPKQFLSLINEDTMLQMTVNRIKNTIPIERVFICTSSKYFEIVKEQLPDIPNNNIIIEPEGRNTAPCIALSTAIINKRHKNSTVLVLPSDHLIRRQEEFISIINASYEFLEHHSEGVVTLGIEPSRPETGYGYIKCGKSTLGVKDKDFKKVDEFVEKPNISLAKKYLQSNEYLWNSGMFLWKNETILKKFEEYLPNTFEFIKVIDELNEAEINDYVQREYYKTDSISIDYGILEKDRDIYVVPCNIGWDDVGTWKALERYSEKDENENILKGDIKIFESNKNIIISSASQVVVNNIDNIYLIEQDGKIFIGKRDNISELKELQQIF